MKIKELEKYLQNLSPELYSFAYVLIPDDLQASQLMIDCVQSYLIQKKLFIEKLASIEQPISKNSLEEIKLDILKIIYELSKKRYQQLKISLKDVEKASEFFSLDFDEKASLYLKEKGDCNLSQIEFITSKTRAENLSYLYSSRTKMTASMADYLFQNQAENNGVI